MEDFNAFLIELKDILNLSVLTMDNNVIRIYHLLGVILFALFVNLLLKFTSRLIRIQINKKGLDEGRTLALYQIVKYIIIVSAILIGMEMVGIKLTILMGGAAALLVGIGLGLQSTFNDIFSGIILLFERSIAIGDILEVGDVIGRVVKINIRTSELVTRDNISILIPNSKVVNDNITSWSHNRESTRFTVAVGVQYGSDVQPVKKLLLGASEEHPDVDKSRSAEVFFQDFGDSALLFDLKFWCNKLPQVGVILSDLRFTIDAK